MEQIFRIKRGLDIPVEGKADSSLRAPSVHFEDFAVRPDDFHGLLPKLLVKEGDRVLAGSPLFFDKNRVDIKIPSPVSGTVKEIIYGPKRRIERVEIQADKDLEYVKFTPCELTDLNAEKVKAKLLESGLWSMIRQRPFDEIAHPEIAPKAIVISGFDTAPLAPDMDMLVHGRGELFQIGLDVIRMLCDGAIYLNLHSRHTSSGVLRKAKGVEIRYFEGPHPAGNIGTQIHRLDPINKGECIWYIHPQDLITIGQLFLKNIYDAVKIVSLAGSELKKTSYLRVLSGVNIKYFIEDNLLHPQEDISVISGNLLTGTAVGKNGYLGFYDHGFCVIPEGNKYRFLGWLSLGLKRYSFSRTFISSLIPRKEYKMDTNLNGGHRAFVMTGEFEKVFPFDIYPLQLIKACIIQDIEEMEKLGIYEVSPEDFALCEYVDISKTDIQKIIRESLDLLKKETAN